MDKRACKTCGQEMEGRKWFCSETCRIAWKSVKPKRRLYRAEHPKRSCIECSQSFRAKGPQQKYCSDSCRGIAWRRKVKEGYATSEQRIRFGILARDGFRCRYCGRTASDGIKLVVDHILPKDKGGDGAPHNLITACVDCNVGKGSLLLLSKVGQIPSFVTIESIQYLPASAKTTS